MKKGKSFGKSECLVCDRPTNQIFNILLKAKHVCPICESLIVRQSIIGRYGKRDDEKV